MRSNKLIYKHLMVLLSCFVILAASKILCTASSSYDDSPAFHALYEMSSSELAAEMRFIIKTKVDGKYYPTERIQAVEHALAKKQRDELKSYEDKLKQEAKEAETIEKIKADAFERAKKELGNQFEQNQDKIQQRAEEIAKQTIGEDKWNNTKDMYQKGAKWYEDKVSSYVDKAQKAYDYYNKYQEARDKNPEAPEAAKNLLGAMAVTGDALKEIGDILGESPTPLKIVGDVLKAYGDACNLGNAAAKNAWNYAHGGENSIHVTGGSVYREGMEKNNITDMDRSALQQYDKNIKIFELGDGKAIAFDSKGNIIQGSNGDILSPDEYKKIQEVYTAWQSMKQSEWIDLSTEELVKLAAGQKADITIKTRIWPFSNVTKEFTLDDIMNKANWTMKESEKQILIKEVDEQTRGSRSWIDGWTTGGRELDISKTFYDYQDYLRKADPDWYKKSEIEQFGSFKELVEKMLKAGKKWDEIKDTVKKMKDSVQQQKDSNNNDNTDPAKQRIRDILGIGKNNVKNGSGSVSIVDGQPSHWVLKYKDEFSGIRDGGFTKIGKVDRQLPDPFALNIPVLKPNIYLYPDIETQVEVAFFEPERVTKSIPEYDKNKAWSVTSKNDGTIDGKYGYLFYEADVIRQYFQKDIGWLIHSQSRRSDFCTILDLYGFNAKEKNDFIEYWDKKLIKGTNYIVFPQETAIVDNAMPISIEPKPFSITRLWFYFEEAGNQRYLEPGSVQKILRNKFTVLEWGGMVN